ncbi:Probable beta-galactosidase OS=Lentisphaera araneosa HTCC2155 GN=LNTAR_09716 PE=4 SV=1: Metallophos_2 [Gemmata massiliana]|uniref:Calcineurin-like phosphoesterase domain-containing protein n=1 Tax=Gemmata massiliana TaxID=1210884 RepID=A0A6P2CZE3_9BACT|nr:metallophosphoesterase [Gemmata massiliana]VTR94223.1 Probable beta-galactosidase OS=Lentisphaera araneosa HTCC2155 GN=LNTAR_09716 PE=4 SV=1: Metallophos_2 [Gemmata massiliana]
MKQFALGLATAGLLGGVILLSRAGTATDATGARADDRAALKVEVGDKNPWTSLKLNNDPDQFTFAIVSDRTGGHRDKVFSRAVQQVNWLQPQFVMSVGDLIEGARANEDGIKRQWDEFDGYVKQFEMPFFYVPGNHDLANKMQVTQWGERYGKRYHHFTYRGALFLCLCAENPQSDGMATIDKEQQVWAAKVLEANKDVRWTFVFLHRPLWAVQGGEKNGWTAVEKALAGRKHNVFCGHVHRYQVFERNDTQYYQLATTGGGSRMRGPQYGEFDQVMLVTMKKDAPVLVNVDLGGVLSPNLRLPDSDEKGNVPKQKKDTFPVTGKIKLDGKPLEGAKITLHARDEPNEQFAAVCDGLSDDAGRFTVTTYSRFDGAPTGEYVVTVVKSDKGFNDREAAGRTVLPKPYARPATSPLKVTIKSGANDIELALDSK